MDSLAEKLVSLRKSRGLTQAQLAERMNVSRQAISRWETGESVPSVTKLKFLSELYDVSVEDLLNDHEPNDQEVELDEGEKPVTDGPHKDKNERGLRYKVVIGLLTVALVASLIVIFFLFHSKEPATGKVSMYELEKGVIDKDTASGFDLEWIDDPEGR